MDYASLEVGMWIFGVVGSVLWYLLKQKDAKQQEEITTLWRKHDEDSERLTELSLEIAKKHYERPELDGKFDRLDASIRDGLKDLGNKFDRLAEALMHKGGNDGR